MNKKTKRTWLATAARLAVFAFAHPCPAQAPAEALQQLNATCGSTYPLPAQGKQTGYCNFSYYPIKGVQGVDDSKRKQTGHCNFPSVAANTTEAGPTPTRSELPVTLACRPIA